MNQIDREVAEFEDCDQQQAQRHVFDEVRVPADATIHRLIAAIAKINAELSARHDHAHAHHEEPQAEQARLERCHDHIAPTRSEEPTTALQTLMRHSNTVFSMENTKK